MLRYRADLRTLAFVTTFYAAFAAAWLLPLTRVQAALLSAFLCVMTFLIAVIVHNTIHHPIFYSKRLNRVFSAVLSLAFGAAAAGYLPGHNLSHHRYLGTTKDHVRPHRMRFRWNLLNQLLFFFYLVPGILRTESRYVRNVSKLGVAREWWTQHRIESALLFVFKVGLLWVDWQKAIAFVFIPNMYGVWGIMGVNYWQHDGCDENDRYNHSRSFTSKLLNFFTHNNGYHGVHHERPSLHWSLLPEYHRRHYHGRCHPELEQRSLVRFLWRAYVSPGVRVKYDGTPYAPPPFEPDEDWVADVFAAHAARGVYAVDENPAENADRLHVPVG